MQNKKRYVRASFYSLDPAKIEYEYSNNADFSDKKAKKNTRWLFILNIIMLFTISLMLLMVLRKANDFALLLFSIAYLAMLILTPSVLFAMDIHWYFKIKRFRKWQMEQSKN